jgi:hypothetical protein
VRDVGILCAVAALLNDDETRLTAEDWAHGPSMGMRLSAGDLLHHTVASLDTAAARRITRYVCDEFTDDRKYNGTLLLDWWLPQRVTGIVDGAFSAIATGLGCEKVDDTRQTTGRFIAQAFEAVTRLGVGRLSPLETVRRTSVLLVDGRNSRERSRHWLKQFVGQPSLVSLRFVSFGWAFGVDIGQQKDSEPWLLETLHKLAAKQIGVPTAQARLAVDFGALGFVRTPHTHLTFASEVKKARKSIDTYLDAIGKGRA